MSNSRILSKVPSDLANNSGKLLSVSNNEIIWEENYAWQTANNASNNITILQGVNTTQNNRITVIEGTDLTQNTSISNLTSWLNGNNSLQSGINTTQNNRITVIEGVDLTQNTNITLIQGVDNTQNTSISSAFVQANSAYTKANSAITLGSTPLYLGGTNTSISGLTLSSSEFNGTVGATTANTGSFTTLNVSGNTTLGDASGDTVAIQAGTAALPTLIPAGDTNTGLWFPAADTVAWSTAGSERVRITSGGNVGIGTSLPGYLLTLNKESATNTITQALRINNPYDAGSNGLSIAWGLAGFSPIGASISAFREATSLGVALAFSTSSSFSTTDATERVRITSGGNLYVGATAAQLGVDKELVINAASGTAGISLGVGGSAKLYAAIGTSAAFATVGSIPLVFQVAQTNRLLINTDATIRIDGSDLNLYQKTNASNLSVSFNTTVQNALTLDSSGNLLVGTTSNIGNSRCIIAGPAGVSNTEGPLFVRSNAAGDLNYAACTIQKYDNDVSASQVLVRFAHNNGGNGAGQINGNGPSQAAFGSYSDARLKENITELPSQLANICALKPTEFDYKDGSGHQIGFIAQEMQEVYPDVVSEGGDGMLMVTGWSKTEARLVSAIKELTARLETLEQRIK